MPEVTPRPKAKKRRKPSTDKRAADELWSKIVRDRGVCQLAPFYDSPCEGPHQACHLIPRRYSATRTYLKNGVCACRHHHSRLDAYEGMDKAELVDRLYGPGHYRYLRDMAEGGIASLGLSPLAFWREQRAALAGCSEGDPMKAPFEGLSHYLDALRANVPAGASLVIDPDGTLGYLEQACTRDDDPAHVVYSSATRSVSFDDWSQGDGWEPLYRKVLADG